VQIYCHNVVLCACAKRAVYVRADRVSYVRMCLDKQCLYV
jgi:hypothetical protein